MAHALTFERVSPDHASAKRLIDELSDALQAITGSSGRASFANGDVMGPRSVFLVARIQDEPVGCGGLREMDATTCELKRMYAARKRGGIGAQILSELEREAASRGYSRIRLETRKVNQAAVSFYLKHGYKVIPNYGKYAGNHAAVCFEKEIPAG